MGKSKDKLPPLELLHNSPSVVLNLSDQKFKQDYLNNLQWTQPIVQMLQELDDEVQVARVVRLALEVDLILGAKLAGVVKQEFKEHTVSLVACLKVPETCRNYLLRITGYKRAIAFHEDDYPQNKENCEHCTAETSVLEPTSDSVTVDALIEGLLDQSSGVRRSAAIQLGQINAPQALDALIQAVGDEDSIVRACAVCALGNIGDPLAVDALIQVLNSDDSDVRVCAVESLGQIYHPSSINALIEALQDQDFNVRSFAAIELGQIGDDSVIDNLIGALQDENFEVRENATESLGKIANPKAVDALIRALKDEMPEVRGGAAGALGQIRDPKAVDVLVQALEDEDYGVRIRAAHALGHIGDVVAVPALINALNYGGISEAAACALATIGTPLAVDALVQACKGEQGSYIYYDSLYAIAQVTNPLSLDILVEACQHEDFAVREIAAEALGKIGAPQALIHLWEMLITTPDIKVSSIVEAIASIQKSCGYYNYTLYKANKS
ncbi:HEAT repeat domain-containing protein [Chlorogloeopsis sp. ULAP01]|uniref:HEAT repeat domain-containing protein n=1 Tax=Chlorogloeopsis sp. ULAP01 TaxID=3056483 RepID=UPI0025AB55FC|nr:HEAT repeat domain-containing protein [Chlorogloeopsis sp. ULAP01]MDM9381353.1 HEAT repeat domain-containing protein [Chlorogloeopsis sp. ULAP01]